VRETVDLDNKKLVISLKITIDPCLVNLHSECEKREIRSVFFLKEIHVSQISIAVIKCQRITNL
jgi:hypothetical protein